MLADRRSPPDCPIAPECSSTARSGCRAGSRMLKRHRGATHALRRDLRAADRPAPATAESFPPAPRRDSARAKCSCCSGRAGGASGRNASRRSSGGSGALRRRARRRAVTGQDDSRAELDDRSAPGAIAASARVSITARIRTRAVRGRPADAGGRCAAATSRSPSVCSAPPRSRGTRVLRDHST